MLTPYLDQLHSKKIILGSSSPRRRDILKENVGIRNFEVVKSNFEEDIDKAGLTPDQYVLKTCEEKIDDIKARIDYDLLICADTVVCHAGKIFEKPVDREAAMAMLRELSGTTHQVLTAVSMITKDRRKSFVEKTIVKFTNLDDKMIESYCDTGEPYDKAGGYGIQTLAASFAEGIEGCPFNVYGFPAHAFCREVKLLLSL